MSHTIFLQNFINQVIAEMSPPYVINACGVPNWVNMWLRRNLTTTLASLVLVGIASTHFET